VGHVQLFEDTEIQGEHFFFKFRLRQETGVNSRLGEASHETEKKGEGEEK